jgi:hypothetical protein
MNRRSATRVINKIQKSTLPLATAFNNMKHSILLSLLLVLSLSINKSNAQDLVPIKGKWNAGDNKDYVGIWKKTHTRAYLDGNGLAEFDALTGYLNPYGTGDQVGINIDCTGDGRDELAVFSKSAGKIYFYQDFVMGTKYSEKLSTIASSSVVITGRWGSNPKDGYATYDPDTRMFKFYVSVSTTTPYSRELGNFDDVPLAGNWDGAGGDGIALYRRSTNQIFVFQEYNQAQSYTWTLPQALQPNDKIISGDWDGNGSDEIAIFRQISSTSCVFFLYNAMQGTITKQLNWTDKADYVWDITGGRQSFYHAGVPHAYSDGSLATAPFTYDPAKSFFPKGVYYPQPSSIPLYHQAGYNLALMFNNALSPVAELKNQVDATNGAMRLVLNHVEVGGTPLVGRFSGGRDLPGIASKNQFAGYYDSDNDLQADQFFYEIITGNRHFFSIDIDGDGRDEIADYNRSTGTIHWGTRPDTEVENTSDVPLSGNWDKTGGDGYALFRLSTRQVFFFNEVNQLVPFHSRTLPTGVTHVVAGDWDGDGYDGFATYNASTRVVTFYQTTSAAGFGPFDIGNPGDIPIAGDWDNDGKDGIGVYRSTHPYARNEFHFFDNISNRLVEYTTAIITHPWLDMAPEYVFGVYVRDEPSNMQGNETPDQMKAYLNAIYSAYSNLNTPVYFHANARYGDGASNWKVYANMGEASSHFVYPLENRTTAENLEWVCETMTLARQQNLEQKPNWYVAQTFQKDGEDFDFFMPTKELYRGSVFTAVVHGATGLFNFCADNSSLGIIIGLPSSNTQLWQETVTVNSQLESLKPYLLSKTPVNPYKIFVQNYFWENSNPIRTLLKYYNGEYVLITVNISNDHFDGILQFSNLLAPASRSVERMFEGSTILTTGGAIKEHYDPWEVHIYKFSGPAPMWQVGGSSVESAELVEASLEDGLTVYPNPASTSVTFQLGDKDASAQLFIFDSQSRLVRALRFGDTEGSLIWDRKSGGGNDVKPGLYFYQLQKGSKTIRGKLILE